MTLSQRWAQIRLDRGARRAVSDQRAADSYRLRVDLPASARRDIEFVAARTPIHEAALTLTLLDQQTFVGGRATARQSD